MRGSFSFKFQQNGRCRNIRMNITLKFSFPLMNYPKMKVIHSCFVNITFMAAHVISAVCLSIFVSFS